MYIDTMVASLVLLLLAAGFSSAASSNYNIVPRSATRKLDVLSPSETPMISFDGDNLAAIQAAALAQASRSSVPDTYSCDEEETVHLEILTWKYSIETAPAAVVATVYGEVQEIVLEQIAPLSLSCRNSDAAYANIVAMDTMLLATLVTEDTCEPVVNASNECSVVIGRMRVYLSDTETIGEATELVLQNIESAFEQESFVGRVESGLIKITFIPDEGTSNGPDSFNDNTIPTGAGIGEEATDNTSLGFLVVAVGSAALVVFVGSVYLWRRGQRGDQDGAATQLAGTNFSGTYEENSRRPTSPYSEMVAGSYRLGDNTSILSSSNMSPVYEEDRESDSASNFASESGFNTTSSMILSEGGYTTDAGNTFGGDSTTFDGSKYTSTSANSTPKFLGARPFSGTVVGDFNMEEISDSDLDTSGEMSPVKMFVGNNLLVPSGNDHEEESDENLLFSVDTSTDYAEVEL